MNVRPYWSPALVAFFGFGGGFHVGVGFGGAGFGWVPLAPFEAFHPWWGHGYYGGYRDRNAMLGNIHITNNFNIASNYRNARIGNGVTAVNSADFARGRVTNTMRLSSSQLQSATLVRGQVPIAPTASSLRFSDRAVASTARTTAFNSNARFFSHNQPAAINRVPFSQQQQSLSQMGRQPSAVQGGRPAISNSTASTGGWRPVGGITARATTPAAPAARASVNGGTAGSGWRRFGEPSVASPESRGATGSPQYNRPPTAAAPSRSYQTYPGPSPGSGPARYSSPRSLQISPPIVRERSSSGSSGASRPSSGGSVSSHGSGGGTSSSHGSGGGSAGGGHGHK
jgi:hypothetical protein